MMLYQYCSVILRILSKTFTDFLNCNQDSTVNRLQNDYILIVKVVLENILRSNC